MRTRIISAFPGTGKSTYHRSHPKTTLDSDSSKFSWVVVDGEKERNPDFPANYIEHIQKNIGKYKFIFVSSHKEVRKALLDNCLFFYLVYPKLGDKNKYLKRYEERGSDEAFIKLLDKNWSNWIDECEAEDVGCENISMRLDSLGDELQHLIITENKGK